MRHIGYFRLIKAVFLPVLVAAEGTATNNYGIS
jgi:hypothetical protein